MSLRALADRPFELLVELERRARAAVAARQGSPAPADEWVGIGFRLGAERFVTSRSDVREVLPVPEQVTRVLPGWTLNLAYLIHSDEALLATERANLDRFGYGVKGFVLSSGTGMSNMIIVTGLGSTFTNSGGATIGGSFNSLIITNGGRFLLGSGALTDLTTTRDDIQAQLDANKNSSDLETELAALKADVANGK